jgi:hypothetical protein
MTPPQSKAGSKWSRSQLFLIALWLVVAVLVPILWFTRTSVRIQAEIIADRVVLPTRDTTDGFITLFLPRSASVVNIEQYRRAFINSATFKQCPGSTNTADLKSEPLEIEATEIDANLRVTKVDDLRLRLPTPQRSTVTLETDQKHHIIVTLASSQSNQPARVDLTVNPGSELACQQCATKSFPQTSFCAHKLRSPFEIEGGAILRLALTPSTGLQPRNSKVPISIGNPEFQRQIRMQTSDAITPRFESTIQAATIAFPDLPTRKAELTEGQQLLFTDQAQLTLMAMTFDPQGIKLRLEGTAPSIRLGSARLSEELVPNLLVRLYESKPWTAIVGFAGLILSIGTGFLGWKKRFQENA